MEKHDYWVWLFLYIYYFIAFYTIFRMSIYSYEKCCNILWLVLYFACIFATVFKFINYLVANNFLYNFSEILNSSCDDIYLSSLFIFTLSNTYLCLSHSYSAFWWPGIADLQILCRSVCFKCLYFWSSW